MGAYQEYVTKRGGRAGHIGEVLLHGKTGGDVVWGRDISVVGTNGTKTRGGFMWDS